jgi:4-amino-4-deoxy-L-arabinose transferase-like glycosyltransferase
MTAAHESREHAVATSRAGAERTEDRPDYTARIALAMFGLALALRLASLLFLHSGVKIVGKDAWSWGYEAACTARSIAAGDGWAGQWNRAQMPWGLGSAATGWLPPAYPLLIALLMKLFGGMTPAMATALLVIQCLLSAATCLFLWGIGAALGESRVGRWAGFLFALTPTAIWNASATVWDTTCVAFGIAAFLFVLFRFGRSPSKSVAFAMGAAFGALLLVNPAPASMFPVAIWFMAAHAKRWSTRAERALAFSAAAFLACLPWLARNELAVGAFSLRTNLGVEMNVGNNDLARGYPVMSVHPSTNGDEFVRYREMGEVPYSSWAMREARAWIEDHPLRFAVLALHRVQLFWLGEPPTIDPREEPGVVAALDPKSWIKWIAHFAAGITCLAGAWGFAREKIEGRYLLAALLLFPVPYYLTHTMERYRFPIEPLIVFMAAWLIVHWIDRRRARRSRDGAGRVSSAGT